MNLKEKLFSLQDLEYRDFSSKLTKTKYPLIGVRIPLIKKIARDLKNEIIDFSDAFYFEEIMLEGLLLGYLKDVDSILEKLDFFIVKIDDWSVCDSVCANLKITKNNKEKIWNYIIKYKNSSEEFKVRFMVVMMINYYLEERYINDIFNIIDDIKCDFYYANMAISWLIATSLVKCENETLKYLNKCNLSDFVFNKAISKARESYRVSSELKDKLIKMKR